jgi:acetyl esterase/lipase
MTSTSEVPKHHGLLFNPHLTFIQKILSFVIDYFMDLKSLGLSRLGSEACDKILSKGRKMALGGDAISKSFLTEWSDASACPLVESKGRLPFRESILHDWNIVDETTVLPDAISAAKNRKGVEVLVRFPSSLLTNEVDEKGTILDHSGCLEVDFDKIEWKTFRHDVPLLIQFHGGGMCFGGSNDAMLITDTARIVRHAPPPSSPNVITVSVNYGLAPEDPFPLGIMDALSVVDYFLKDSSPRDGIHITGMSAGANIALVAGFEGFRRFPGKILSIQAQSPFLHPGADSMSYHMNQKVYPSPTWLRWCWRIYLGLEHPEPSQAKNDDGEQKLKSFLRQDSNHSSWKKWRNNYPSEALHRLVNPLLGIPEGLDADGKDSRKPPTILLRYNKGDPLHDDGKYCEDALRAKAGTNAKIFVQSGLHCDVVGPYDVKDPHEFWKVWSDTVFGGGY